MREHVGADRFDTTLGELARQLDERPPLRVVVGRDVAGREVPIVLTVRDAVDRAAALPGSAGVPRHDVEALDQWVLEPAVDAGRDRARRNTGTAVVRQQHTDPAVGGRPVAGDPEVDRLPLGVAVVERDRDPAPVDSRAEILELDRVLERFGDRRGGSDLDGIRAGLVRRRVGGRVRCCGRRDRSRGSQEAVRCRRPIRRTPRASRRGRGRQAGGHALVQRTS